MALGRVCHTGIVGGFQLRNLFRIYLVLCINVKERVIKWRTSNAIKLPLMTLERISEEDILSLKIQRPDTDCYQDRDIW